jgi:hypothetical protein
LSRRTQLASALLLASSIRGHSRISLQRHWPKGLPARNDPRTKLMHLKELMVRQPYIYNSEPIVTTNVVAIPGER